jgi:hypothetical protein
MPKRSAAEGRPREGVSPGDWPDGPLCDDDAIRYVQLVARAIVAHLRGESLRSSSRAAGVSAMTVTGIRDGDRYPDLRTLARLERAAGTGLLPDWTDRRGAIPVPAERDHTAGSLSLDARDDEETR